MPTNPLSTVGLMLTLAGLVGSFFNIQLTQWLRDLAALLQKTRLNRAQGTEPQQRAIVECKIEFQKLSHGQTYAVNFLVLGFVVFVLIDGLLMIGSASTDPLYTYVDVALWVFLVFFIAVSGWLILSGWCVARKIRTILNPAA